MFILLVLATSLSALAQPTPANDPAVPHPNVFFGATPPNGAGATAIVFVHGLKGTAADWWVGNDMYASAYTAGFRTAFISLSADNSRNDTSTEVNAAVLRTLLPKIVTRFNTRQVYLIGHSKGGLDIQLAMLNEATAKLVKGVFTLDTPNRGTELADCAIAPPGTACFLAAQQFGLQGESVKSLRIATVAALRAQADPVFEKLGVPFYTLTGSTSLANPITIATGVILSNLRPGQRNDGLVTVENTRLPSSYAVDLGEVFANHFAAIQGSVSWAKIWSRLQMQELTVSGFQKIATGGFGDPSNTWIWSMKWFKGALYVGTGREVNCVSLATNAVQANQPATYPPVSGNCPPDMRDLQLAAELWRYTPETKLWTRVYKSPVDIPITVNGTTKMTARDIGYRGMATFREADGTDALYVTGVSSSSIFEDIPPYNQTGFPSPRILRSVDGVNWAPLPATPGTFLGDLVKNSPDRFKVRGFREILTFNGKLYVTASDYIGTGFVIASANPKAGDNAWQAASPPADVLPIRTIGVFNNQLYVTGGDRRVVTPDAAGKLQPVGYLVYRSPNPTSNINSYVPVITQGGGMPLGRRSPDALSLLEYKGKLFVGTDRPCEMVRINPDDSWDLITGEPRMTPLGYKTPLSGFGVGHANTFLGHYYRFGILADELYVGTWDWSVSLQELPVLNPLFLQQAGFDLYKTKDGIRWTAVTHAGMYDMINYGVRAFETTPFGMFFGTTRVTGGAQVWLNNSGLDLDGDGDIDQADVNKILAVASASPLAGPDDPRDLDRDGKITILDARKLVTQCTLAGCASPSAGPALPLPPTGLTAAPAQSVGRQAILTWNTVPGAVRYRVYRSKAKPVLSFLPPGGIPFELPGLGTIFIPQDVLNGKLDPFCDRQNAPTSVPCIAIDLVSGFARNPQFGFPEPFVEIAITPNPTFTEAADPILQSRYFIRSEDSSGRLSEPSTLVGAPSLIDPSAAAALR